AELVIGSVFLRRIGLAAAARGSADIVLLCESARTQRTQGDQLALDLLDSPAQCTAAIVAHDWPAVYRGPREMSLRAPLDRSCYRVCCGGGEDAATTHGAAELCGPGARPAGRGARTSTGQDRALRAAARRAGRSGLPRPAPGTEAPRPGTSGDDGRAGAALLHSQEHQGLGP